MVVGLVGGVNIGTTTLVGIVEAYRDLRWYDDYGICRGGQGFCPRCHVAHPAPKLKISLCDACQQAWSARQQEVDGGAASREDVEGGGEEA